MTKKEELRDTISGRGYALWSKITKKAVAMKISVNQNGCEKCALTRATLSHAS